MNTNINVNIFGCGQPLVLLHGWGWDSTIWQPLVPTLSKYYKLFLIDLPGMGKSPPLNSYTCENIVSGLFKIVPPQAIWLGWSLGGMIAWWAAAHYPERVSRFITVCSSPRFLADIDWPGVLPSVLKKFALNLENDAEKTLQDFLELQLRGCVVKPILPVEKIKMTAEGLQGGLHLLETLDLRSVISKIKVPSLHIFGSHDVLVPKSVAEIIKPVNGKCEIIAKAGHIPFLTHREEFCEKIMNFFKRFI